MDGEKMAVNCNGPNLGIHNSQHSIKIPHTHTNDSRLDNHRHYGNNRKNA